MKPFPCKFKLLNCWLKPSSKCVTIFKLKWKFIHQAKIKKVCFGPQRYVYFRFLAELWIPVSVFPGWVKGWLKKGDYVLMGIDKQGDQIADLSPFGRLFKAHGNNYFDPNRPNFWQLFGRFLKDGSNLNFLCYKENLNLKFWRNCHFGQLLHQKEYQKYVFLAIKEVRTDTKYHFGQLLLQKEDPK